MCKLDMVTATKKAAKKKGTAKNLSNVLDVTLPAHIPKIHDMLKKNKVVIVLIWANYCGHCHKYKDSVWKNLLANSKRRAGLMTIHHDQLENVPEPIPKTVDGYPSVFRVTKSGDVKAYTSDEARDLKGMNSHAEMNDEEESDSESDTEFRSENTLKLTDDAENEQRLTENSDPDHVIESSRKNKTDISFEGPPQFGEDIKTNAEMNAGLNSQNGSKSMSVEEEEPQPPKKGGSLYNMLVSTLKCKKKGKGGRGTKRTKRSKRSRK